MSPRKLLRGPSARARAILAVLPEGGEAWTVAQVAVALDGELTRPQVESALRSLVRHRLVRSVPLAPPVQRGGERDRGRARHGWTYQLSPKGRAVRDSAPPSAATVDDGGLLKPDNTTRGALAFREALRQFGLRDLVELAALPPATRSAFEGAWTRAMYAACAAAGEPIPAVREGGNGMWDKTRRAAHADSIRRAFASRRP